MITLEQVKLYLRIDSSDEDALLEHLMKVAEKYLRDAVGGYETLYKLDEGFAATADFLMLVLTAEYYQNRSNEARGDFGYAVRALMTQLQMWTQPRDLVERMMADEDEGYSDSGDVS